MRGNSFGPDLFDESDIKVIIIFIKTIFSVFIEGFDTKYESNVEVRYTGHCSWLPPAILYSSCEVDMTYFPFDVQTCPLKFGSWSYTKSKLELSIYGPTNQIIGQVKFKI